MADYAGELGWLYGLSPRGIVLGLERMHEALALRGDPHRGIRFVHVGGTNGKGSVSSMVASALRRSGLRTGLYTSPHLHRYVERVRIGGRPIREREAAVRLGSLRRDRRLPPLSFFEVTTLLAFEAFRDAGCDVVVLEVGLGGRLDATNVVDPLVSVVTNIGLEHQAYLGDTIEAIAREKAGIWKPGRRAIVGARDPSARAVLLAEAERVGAPTWALGDEITATDEGGSLSVRGPGFALAGLALGLAGAHQRDNAACAIAALAAVRESGVVVPDSAIRDALAHARWPGRLETIAGAPEVLLDCAHNPDGCRTLARHLDASPVPGPTVLVFGAMADKDHEGMLAAFDGRVAARVYAVPSMTRAPDPAIFRAIREGEVASDVPRGLERARALAGPRGRVVVAGSIFVAAAARAALLGLRSDPPIGM